MRDDLLLSGRRSLERRIKAHDDFDVALTVVIDVTFRQVLGAPAGDDNGPRALARRGQSDGVFAGSLDPVAT